MKEVLVALGIVVILAIGLAPPAFAAQEVGITCTVTPQSVSVTVNTTSIAYGVVDVSQTSSEIVATNNGNAAENFNIKGANATGSGGDTTWTLSTAVGANQYMHEFAKPTYPTAGTHTNWTSLTTTYQPLAASIAPSGTQLFKLQIWTPSSTTGYGQCSTTVTIQAVAA